MSSESLPSELQELDEDEELDEELDEQLGGAASAAALATGGVLVALFLLAAGFLRAFFLAAFFLGGLTGMVALAAQCCWKPERQNG